MKTSLRVLALLSLVAGLFASAPQAAQAASAAPQPWPEGLQEAVLSASARPFVQQRGQQVALSSQGLQVTSLKWGVALRGLGRGSDVADVAAPEIIQTDARLEYRRGSLTEWYRDTALGVEQ